MKIKLPYPTAVVENLISMLFYILDSSYRILEDCDSSLGTVRFQLIALGFSRLFNQALLANLQLETARRKIGLRKK